MKTVLTKFLAISSVALLMLTSCKKNDALVTANVSKAGSLAASTTTPVIDQAKLGDTTAIITFSFTASQYGLNLPETNILQIDSVGDNWKNPASFTLPAKAVSQGFSTAGLDAMLLKVALPNVSTKVNVRVAHQLSSSTSAYSNVISLTVTPINLTQWIYVAGAFENWTVPGAGVDSLVSATGNGVYVGIINFTPGNTAFKILMNPKNYNGNIGSDGTATGLTSASTQSNIVSTVTGQTLVTVDLNSNTIAFAAADYYSIVGSAPPGTAWNTDTFMKYVNDNTGTWVINNVPMIVGEYKFRQDAAWTNSWGPTATPGIAISTGAVGDGNIQLTVAGNYDFTFVRAATPASPPVTLTSVTAAYTAVKQ